MNDAATGTVNVPKDITAATATSARATTSVAFDLAAAAYTITVGGRSQTFSAEHLDAANSTAGAAVYSRTSGTTTDTLTLTKPGTSGPLNYEYVGVGFWQRTIDSATVVTGSLDGFAYGIQTSAASTPRTGRAEYAVTLLGVETFFNDIVRPFSGSGVTQVDFASGGVVSHGSLNAGPSDGNVWSSAARLSSSTNTFSGDFRLWDGGVYIGHLDGRFYGPAAQEIGAAFHGSTDDGRAVVGALIGRGAAVTATNVSMDSLTVNEFLTNDAGAMRATLTAAAASNNMTGTFSGRTQGTASIIVNYEPATWSYTLISSDGSALHAPASLLDNQPFHPVALPSSAGSLNFLSHVQLRRWASATSVTGGTLFDIKYVALGVETPDALLPRTGSAGYRIAIIGTAADSDHPNLVKFEGMGVLDANFATGAITAEGRLDYIEDYGCCMRPPAQATGFLNMSATLSSAANTFDGSVTLSGIGNYSGTAKGRFYNPSASQVGAAFSASDGAGGVLSGGLIGERDATLAPLPGLTSLTSTTSLEAQLYFDSNRVLSTSGVNVISYNPTTQTYDLHPEIGRSSNFIFGPGEKVAAQSNAAWTVYQASGPGGSTDTITAKMFNPGPSNTALALTYASFADLTVDGRFGTRSYYMLYGVPTPTNQAPITGSASYAGIVYGSGTMGLTDSAVTLDGTSTLTANFGAQTFTSTLNIVARDNATSVQTTLSPLVYTGAISGGVNLRETPATGFPTFSGSFYGPKAAEYAASFMYTSPVTASGQTKLMGVTVGKKTP